MNSQNSASQSATDSDKDSRLKYVDTGAVFRDRASTIDLYCKLSQKSCERLALYLKAQKPSTAKEFELVEKLKDFVVKTSKANEETVQFLDYVKGLLSDIAIDSKVLIDGAILRDKLHFQSQTIASLIDQRDRAVNEIIENKRNDLRR